MSTYEEVGREEGLLEGDEPSRDAEGRCNDVDVEGLWTTVRAWRTRRLWGGHLARQVWRGDRGVYRAGRSWARPDGTGGNRVYKYLGLGRSSYLPTAAA
jgi:hypothetical protein